MFLKIFNFTKKNHEFEFSSFFPFSLISHSIKITGILSYALAKSSWKERLH